MIGHCGIPHSPPTWDMRVPFLGKWSGRMKRDDRESIFNYLMEF